MDTLKAQRGAPWAGGPPGRSGAMVSKAECGQCPRGKGGPERGEARLSLGHIWGRGKESHHSRNCGKSSDTEAAKKMTAVGRHRPTWGDI